MSIKIDLNFDNKITLTDVDKDIIEKMGMCKVFENFLNTFITQKYPNGLEQRDVRCLNRLYNKLDTNPEGTIDLEGAEIDFIRGVLLDPNIRVEPKEVRIFMQFLDKFEKL